MYCACACGDGGGTGNTWARNTQSITFICKDNDGNGQIDLQVCNAWGQNGNDVCNGVAQAIPGTGSKCRCETFNILGPLAVGVTRFGADVAGAAGPQRLAIILMFGTAVALFGMVRSRRRRAV